MLLHGQRLKKLRLEAGYTQKELADMLGISPSAVGMYEQNRRSPDDRTLLKLCEMFRTSADHLLGNDQINEPSLPKNTETELTVLIGEIKKEISEKGHVTFKGVPLSKEDITRIFNAMRTGAEIILKKNRKKYTAARKRSGDIQRNTGE
jgi:transcriptional regulator with XRE-family HTH domain